MQKPWNQQAEGDHQKPHLKHLMKYILILTQTITQLHDTQPASRKLFWDSNDYELKEATG